MEEYDQFCCKNQNKGLYMTSMKVNMYNTFIEKFTKCHEWPWTFQAILEKIQLYDCHKRVEWHEENSSHKHFGFFL